MIDKKFLTQATAWLAGSRDFNEGVSVLEQAKFRPVVVQQIKKQSMRPGAADRLEFQMRALVSAFCTLGGTENVVDTDPDVHVFDGEVDNPVASPEAQKGIMSHESDETALGMVAKRYADLYRRRDKAFNAMKAVGEKNDDESLLLRKQYSADIDECDAQMEKLYPLYERWEKEHILPTDAEVDSVINGDDEPSEEMEGPAVYKWADWTDKEELVKEQYNIAKRIQRSRNKLTYQDENKLAVENPMPDGPKRVKLEKRIELLSSELESIKMKIASFG